jgi:hypothetical protein
MVKCGACGKELAADVQRFFEGVPRELTTDREG